MINLDRLFVKVFGQREPRLLISSPGRVNLIGEHTDYNEGFVLPASIDKSIGIIIAPREDTQCKLFAADFDEFFECDINEIQRSDKHWPNYIIGIVNQMQKQQMKLRGFEMAFGGNIPIGAGLSSSAAVETGTAFALNELFELGLSKIELVKLSQKSENEFVGVRCGIMDQFVNIFGKGHNVIKLDCRSLDYEYIPFERTDLRIILCDTQVRRELASSEYNVIRTQCTAGVLLLQKHFPFVRSLRDITEAMLVDRRKELDSIIFERCKFVIDENNRVLEGCNDLQRSDFLSFGKRMFESHKGLRDEYEVSSPELDLLVEIAQDLPGVYGSRMMGAGFGGCTINLVEEQSVDEFTYTMKNKYQQACGQTIKVYICSIQSGTTKVVINESFQPLQAGERR